MQELKMGFSMNQLIALSKYRDSKINCHFLSVIVVSCKRGWGKIISRENPNFVATKVNVMDP
jgi:hypothetical protein